MVSNHDIFSGRTVVIATQHRKEQVIAPILDKAYNIDVVVPDDFDTDQFGTFTREIKRKGNQLEAARKKALAALQLTGHDLAIASEGSFDAHPSIPFLQSNYEILLLVDTKNNLEIAGHYRTSDTNIATDSFESIEELDTLIKKHKFPDHGLILRTSDKSDAHILKHIETVYDLRRESEVLLYKGNKKLIIETDLRAHRNPTRMKAIEKAAKDLVKNMKSLCPKCETPGFVMTGMLKGLPCKWCEEPTELPLSYTYSCSKCAYTENRPSKKYGDKADPQYCSYCNP